jgi:UDP-N-acetyl-2-amino-2-deoxyglucuronate dehydrogenase
MIAATLGVGIVGYGSIGRTHHRALSECEGVEVVAATRSRAGAGPRELDASLAWCTDAEELIGRTDVDVVCICTPSGSHATLAIEALRNGKHVVVEKPLCTDLETGERAVRLARNSGQLLSVISQRRFEPQNVHLRGLLHERLLGRPILGEALVRWYRGQDYYDSAPWRGTLAEDGGVLLNQAIHVIDLLCWLLGPVAEVSATTATLAHEMEAEDTAVATLHFASGALGVVAASTATRPGLPAELNLFFERGAVSVHDDRVVRWDVPEPLPAPPVDAGAGSGAADPAAITALGHLRQWRDIVAALREGREPSVTGEDGLATVAVVLSAYESARTCRPVRPAEAVAEFAAR